MGKQWIKMWCAECLEGSIRLDLTPAERGVWYDLLLWAGSCRVQGSIQRTEGIPYTFEEIASRLKIDVALLTTTVNKCMEEGRIYMKAGAIYISNWNRYQATMEDKRKANPDEARAFRQAALYRLASEFPEIVNKLANPVKINPDGTIQNPEVLKGKGIYS